MQTLDEKKMKLWRKMLKEFKEPVKNSTRPEQKRDIRVCHPECPYSDKRTGIVVESRYVWWVNHPEDPILPGEVIHHINGNRQDNRIENLAKLPWFGHAKLHQDMKSGRVCL